MGLAAYVNDPAKDSIAAAWAAPSVSAHPQHQHQSMTESDQHQTATESIVKGTAESRLQASTSQPDNAGIEKQDASIVVAATQGKDSTADNATLLLAQELEVAKEQNQRHEEHARYISDFESIDISCSKPAIRSCFVCICCGLRCTAKVT